jgi:hypothetical protein
MNLIGQCFPTPYGEDYVKEIYDNYLSFSWIIEVDGQPAGYIISKLMTN